MAFEGLSEKLSAAFKKLRGKGRLSEADVKEAMREIRLALLEADVSFKVVKQFVAQVTEKAVGADVLEALSPAQQIIKIVNQELTELMGGSAAKLTIASKPPTVIMMVGLQGAGKTTNGAKLAGLMKKQSGKRPKMLLRNVKNPLQRCLRLRKRKSGSLWIRCNTRCPYRLLILRITSPPSAGSARCLRISKRQRLKNTAFIPMRSTARAKLSLYLTVLKSAAPKD